MKRKLFTSLPRGGIVTRLLLALIALVGGVTDSAADTDVTASYIGDISRIVNGGGHNHSSNNHKESNGIGWWNNQELSNGWHAFFAPGDPGESWTSGFGSAGVMMGRTMVLPTGRYTLSFEAFGTNASNSTDNTVSPAAGDCVAFLTGQDNIDITNTTVGGNTFHNVSFTFDVTANNTAYEFGIKKLTNDSKIDWCQIKNIKLTLNSTNIFVIPNDNVNSFTYSGSQTWHTNTWSTEGQTDGSRFQVPFHELWVNSSSKLNPATIVGSYTPSNTGVYKVSAWVRAVNESGMDVSGAKIFVGDSETDVCSGTTVINGHGRLGTYTAMADAVSGTPFNYGFKIDEGTTVNWIAFKNVTITYLGDLPESESNALITKAKAIALFPLDAERLNALNNALSAFENSKSVANFNALNSACTLAELSLSNKKLYFFNAASKQFLTSGNWWGTHAALDDDGMPISIEMSPNGKYYLSTTSAFNGKYVNGPWMDSSNKQEWSIDAVTGTDYFTLKNANNKYLYYTGTPNVADETDAAPTGEAYYWKIFSKEQLIARLSEATSERPVDATFFMTNGKVRYGWSASIQGTTEWGTNSFNADAVGLYNGGCNSYTQWHKKFDNYQSLENLPNGKYTVTVKGLYTTSNGFSSIPYLYANNAKASLTPRGVEQDPVSKELVDDSHLVGPLTVFVTDGKLQVGIKSDEAASWVIWREFTIKYLGTEVTPDDASALISSIPEGTMNNDVRTALTSAKTIFEGDKTWENYQALANAIADAQASIDAYEKTGNVLPKMKELIDATNVYTQEAYNNYYGTWQAKYEAGTLTTDEANALEDPTVITGVHAENTVDDFLTSAWDFAPLIWEGFHVNTWSTEGDTDGSGFRVPFYEYWTGDGNSLVARTATATMSGLEAGDYAVSAWVRVRLKNGAPAPATGITMQVNDGTEADVCDGTKIGNSNFYLKKVFAFGTVGQNGNLSIKFNVADGTNISWLSFKNVKFEKATPNIAAFKAAQPTEAVVLNLTGAEFLASLDGTTYVQDATGGIAIPNFTISGATVDKAKLSGQLYGTYEADNKFIVKDTTVNAVVAKEGEATVYTLTPQEAIKTENIYRLVKLETMNVAKLNDQAGTLLVDDGDTEVYINESLFEGDVNDYMRTGDVLNSITGVTFFDHTNYNNLAPRTSDDIVPLLWGANEVENGTVAQGVDISGDNAIDLSTANKLTRMANLAAGDVLNLNVALEAGSTYDNITVSTSDGRAVYTIPVLEAATTVEIPVTAFMESDIQRHGLKISAGKSTTKAKFITVTTDKYTDVENSIWLGAAPQNYQGSYLRLHAIHFDDVRVGDMLKNTGASPELTFHKNAAQSRALSGETIVLEEGDVEFLYDHEMTIDAAADLTKVAYILGDDPRNDIVETQEGEAYAQGDKVLADGMIMTFGGDEPEGKKYEFKEQYPPVNKFGTATKGISQQPTDAEGKAYAEAEKNVPTKGTYYQFDALKDGQLEVSIDLESGKKLYVVDETGEPVEGFNGVNVTDSKVTIAAKATKTYTVFAPESDLKYYGFKFTPANSEAGNKAKDIATFKLLPAEGVADTLLLKDAVVNYIKGDDVFVSDATGAIDIYQTHIQFYVGQVLNGYIVGKNGFDRKLVYLPQLQRTDATKYGQFKVTEDVTPEPAVISVADALKQENLNKFAKIENVMLSQDKHGFKVLLDTLTKETVRVEDHFNVFYELNDTVKSITGIVGISSDSTYIFWPTSKEGVVSSKTVIPEDIPADLADGKYYLKNVKSGLWWSAGNNWGTQASLLKNADFVTLHKVGTGKYQMESQVSNGGTAYYFNDDNKGAFFMDNGNPTELTIYVKGDNLYTIGNGNALYGYNNSTTLAGDVQDMENALWEIYTEEDLRAELENASEQNPVDATFLVIDHTFGRNHRAQNNRANNNKGDGTGVWEVSSDCTNYNLVGGNSNKHCGESYHSKFTITQTITNVPNGTYAMTAQGFYRQDGSDEASLPVFFINDATAQVPLKTGAENSMADACTSFEGGAYTIEPIKVEVINGTIKLGISNPNNASLWVIWDNIQLQYLGSGEISLDSYIAAYEKALQKAQDAAKEYMPANVKETLDEVIAANSNVDRASKTALTDATEALNDATAAAQSSISTGKTLKAMKELTEKTNFYTEEAYDQYYGTWIAKYDAGTLTAEEAAALQNPTVVTDWHAQNTVDDLLLSTWDAQPEDWATYHINTWSVEGNTDGSNFRVPFYEYWTGDAESLGEKVLTGTMSGLAEGSYDVQAWVRVRIKNDAAAPATGITMQVNDGTAVDVAAGDQIGTSQFYLKEYTATGNVGSDGVLKLKFNVAADNNISWLSFRDVKILGLDDEAEVLYSWESPEGTPVEQGGKIEYVNGDGNRLNYQNSDYYTICLNGKKANIDETTASANAGHMVVTLDKALEEGDVIAITAFVNKDSSKKSSAYILYETGANDELVYSDEANINEAIGGTITTKTTTVTAAAAGSKTIKLTRGQTGTNLFITKLEITRGGATGISETVAPVRLSDGAIYNLNGVKVGNTTEGLKPGLYIKNGKKVIVK